MDVLTRSNVQVHGRTDAPPMVFSHGFGCDQNMWRFVWPEFADEFRVVLFDYIEPGRSDRSAFDPARYATLDGYARDLLDMRPALELDDGVYVVPPVIAMIGVLA